MKTVTIDCPKCNKRENINYQERLGGIAGFNDIYVCLGCKIKYTVMYMSEKPVYKKIIEDDMN